jgi:hypothetical protein
MVSSAMMARAVVVAVLLLQCCNVVLGARLLEGDGGWLHRGGGAAGKLIMQVLQKGGSAPGGANGCTPNPNHPPSGKCHSG